MSRDASSCAGHRVTDSGQGTAVRTVERALSQPCAVPASGLSTGSNTSRSSSSASSSSSPVVSSAGLASSLSLSPRKLARHGRTVSTLIALHLVSSRLPPYNAPSTVHVLLREEHQPLPTHTAAAVMVTNAPCTPTPSRHGQPDDPTQAVGPYREVQGACGRWVPEGLAMLRRSIVRAVDTPAPAVRHWEVRTPLVSIEDVCHRPRHEDGGKGKEYGEGRGWVQALAHHIVSELLGPPCPTPPPLATPKEEPSYAEVVTVAMGAAATGKSRLLLGSLFETNVRRPPVSHGGPNSTPATMITTRIATANSGSGSKWPEGGGSLLASVLHLLYSDAHAELEVAVSLLEVRDAAPLASLSPQERATEAVDLLSAGGRVDTFTPPPPALHPQQQQKHLHQGAHTRGRQRTKGNKATGAPHIVTRTGCFMRRSCDLPAARYVSCASAAEALAVIGKGLARARAAGWEEACGAGTTVSLHHHGRRLRRRAHGEVHDTNCRTTAAEDDGIPAMVEEGEEESEGGAHVVRPREGHHPAGPGRYGHTLLTLLIRPSRARGRVGVWKLWDLAGTPVDLWVAAAECARTPGHTSGGADSIDGHGVGGGSEESLSSGGGFTWRTHRGLCELLGSGLTSMRRCDPVCNLLEGSLRDTASLFTLVGVLQQDGAMETVNEDIMRCAVAVGHGSHHYRGDGLSCAPTPRFRCVSHTSRRRRAANAIAATRVLDTFAMRASVFLSPPDPASPRLRTVVPVPPAVPTRLAGVPTVEKGAGEGRSAACRAESQPLSTRLTVISPEQSELAQPLSPVRDGAGHGRTRGPRKGAEEVLGTESEGTGGVSPVAPPSVAGTQRPTPAEKRRSLEHQQSRDRLQQQMVGEDLSHSLPFRSPTQLFPLGTAPAPERSGPQPPGQGWPHGTAGEKTKASQLTLEATLLGNLQNAFLKRIRECADDARKAEGADTAALARVVQESCADLNTLARIMTTTIARTEEAGGRAREEVYAELQSQLTRVTRTTLLLEEKLLKAHKQCSHFGRESTGGSPHGETIQTFDALLDAFTQVVGPLVTQYELALEASARERSATTAAAAACAYRVDIRSAPTHPRLSGEHRVAALLTRAVDGARSAASPRTCEATPIFELSVHTRRSDCDSDGGGHPVWGRGNVGGGREGYDRGAHTPPPSVIRAAPARVPNLLTPPRRTGGLLVVENREPTSRHPSQQRRQRSEGGSGRRRGSCCSGLALHNHSGGRGTLRRQDEGTVCDGERSTATDHLWHAAESVRDAALRILAAHGQGPRTAALTSSERYPWHLTQAVTDEERAVGLFDALTALQSATALVNEEVRQAAERERMYLNAIL